MYNEDFEFDDYTQQEDMSLEEEFYQDNDQELWEEYEREENKSGQIKQDQR